MQRSAVSFLLVALLFLTATAANAQAIPDKFTNLKVLPADIAKAN